MFGTPGSDMAVLINISKTTAEAVKVTRETLEIQERYEKAFDDAVSSAQEKHNKVIYINYLIKRGEILSRRLKKVDDLQDYIRKMRSINSYKYGVKRGWKKANELYEWSLEAYEDEITQADKTAKVARDYRQSSSNQNLSGKNGAGIAQRQTLRAVDALTTTVEAGNIYSRTSAQIAMTNEIEKQRDRKLKDRYSYEFLQDMGMISPDLKYPAFDESQGFNDRELNVALTQTPHREYIWRDRDNS